jgi:hypothetical protein
LRCERCDARKVRGFPAKGAKEQVPSAKKRRALEDGEAGTANPKPWYLPV